MEDNEKYNAKGKNTIVMNQSTMVNAVQLWVDTFMLGDHRVTVVKKAPNDYGGSTIFEVDLMSGEAQKE